MEALSLLKPVKFNESLPTVTTSTLFRSCMEIKEQKIIECEFAFARINLRKQSALI
jgi:hypothetical protein